MTKIAIVGSGISGLVCAHRLSEHHEVTVFEANDYAGGHTATVDISVNGSQYAIDTGFIVFNDRTYPRFMALLSELNVNYQSTEMSFSVNNPDAGLIYNGNTINSMFCQRKNILSPRFWKFVTEIIRFNADCKRRFSNRESTNNTLLGEHLAREGYSDFFAKNYILPMAAAIWSTSLAEVAKFPLTFFIQFFYNHGLLDIHNRPQWYTIKGGSRVYVDALLHHCKAQIELNTPVQGIQRTAQGVLVRTANGEHIFDDVILACHSDQSLDLIQDPTEDEVRVLSAIPYSSNEVVLHTDPAMLPPIPAAVASWNYHLSTNDVRRKATVTYSMNTLQKLPDDAPSFNVSLNCGDAIRPEHVLGKYNYNHPVFNEEMVAAQSLRDSICGVDKIHFCGAYWYNGFHEDGVRSAEDICGRWL